jgi:hypothetical protein
MASKVQIANRALQKIGQRRIVDFNENSDRSNEIDACYEFVKNAELETNVWRFSIERVSIAAMSTAPAFGRDNQYQLPADFIRPAPIDPDISHFPSDILWEGTKVLTNDVGPLQLRYVSSAVSEQTFSPLFVEALAARIAIEICEKLTGSNSKKDSLESAYTFHITKARSVDAIIRGPTESEVDEWIHTRIG